MICESLFRLGKHMLRNKKNKNHLKSYMIGNSLMKKKLKIKDKNKDNKR